MLINLATSDSSRITFQVVKKLVESCIVESVARRYGTDPNYDDYEQMTPIGFLALICCGLDFSSEDLGWWEKNSTMCRLGRRKFSGEVPHLLPNRLTRYRFQGLGMLFYRTRRLRR
jgi:hypothetical protein